MLTLEQEFQAYLRACGKLSPSMTDELRQTWYASVLIALEVFRSEAASAAVVPGRVAWVLGEFQGFVSMMSPEAGPLQQMVLRQTWLLAALCVFQIPVLASKDMTEEEGLTLLDAELRAVRQACEELAGSPPAQGN